MFDKCFNVTLAKKQLADIVHIGQTWMAKCNQLTSLPFKGLKKTEPGAANPKSIPYKYTQIYW